MNLANVPEPNVRIGQAWEIASDRTPTALAERDCAAGMRGSALVGLVTLGDRLYQRQTQFQLRTTLARMPIDTFIDHGENRETTASTQPGAAQIHSCGPIEMRDRLLDGIAALKATKRLLGGVGSIEHVRQLTMLPVWGAIVGRSLYEGKVDLREAKRSLQLPNDGEVSELAASNPSLWVLGQAGGRYFSYGSVPPAAAASGGVVVRGVRDALDVQRRLVVQSHPAQLRRVDFDRRGRGRDRRGTGPRIP